MKKLLGGIVISALLAAPALAADLRRPMPVKAPPPVVATVYSWTGCYIGAFGGYKTGRVHHETAAIADFSEYRIRGGLAGGALGCNWQAGTLVYGIEGDGAWMGAKGDGFAPNPAFTLTARERWLATVRGRLGVAVNQWLIYATGGVAFASLKVTETAPGGTTMTDDPWATGWVVGGGTEYGLTQNWSIKAEYLYARFGSRTYFDGVTPCVGCTTPQDIKYHNHIVKVGVNYRFGGPVVARY